MRTSEAVDIFLKSRREKLLSEDTIVLYQWVLTKLEVDFPDNLPTTRSELQSLFNSHRDLSLASQKTIRDRLRIFWSWLEDEGLCDSNPLKKMPSPRTPRTQPRVLGKAEIDQLLKAAKNERNRTILAVFLDTGLRVGELATLTPKNIGPDGLKVQGKVGSRVVPISPHVYNLLRCQGDVRGCWIGIKGRMTRGGIQQVVRSCMERAGFSPPKIGPHTLRHTFGVQYMVNGGDIASLQRIMGHTKVETTMLYVHMSNSLVTDQHRKFSPMSDMIFAAD